MTVRRFLIILAACACVTGCLMNSNHALPEGAAPAPGRGVLVYGVKLETARGETEVPLEMVAYDIARQKIDGGCTRFNRTEARIAAAPAGIRYFAFDVVPGHYTLTPFLYVSSTAQGTGFHVAAGSTVYVGDFIYQAGDRLALVRDLPASKSAIFQALPHLAADMTAATPIAIEPAHMFMCTP